MQLVFILEQVLNGLLVGAYYLLIALGLSLIFALGGIVNLAHGGFYAIGAYLAVILADRIGFAGALVASPLAVGLIGVAVERLLFRRFYRSDPILSLLLTFGLAMVIEQGLRPDVVGALGISLAPYMTAIAALGVGLAGLAGVLLAPIAGVHPAMGAEILTAAFVVVVIGGLGSFWGVIAAAMLVGIVRGITIYFNPSWGEASMYLLMALVLLVRPRGLFGERIQKFE